MIDENSTDVHQCYNKSIIEGCIKVNIFTGTFIDQAESDLGL